MNCELFNSTALWFVVVMPTLFIAMCAALFIGVDSRRNKSIKEFDEKNKFNDLYGNWYRPVPSGKRPRPPTKPPATKRHTHGDN